MDKVETRAIHEILAGNPDAYRVLMTRHFQSVYRVAFRITGNPDDAEDATQEAFLRAYNKLPSFRKDSSFGTWVTRIVMNTAINLVERRNRDLGQHAPRIVDDMSVSTNSIQVADRQAGPERLLLDREATLLRDEAMILLTPMERTAFVLRHMEDLPSAEIAAALNVSQNSVKQAVFRAVCKLRRALAPIAGARP